MIKDCQDFLLIHEPGPRVKLPRQELQLALLSCFRNTFPKSFPFFLDLPKADKIPLLKFASQPEFMGGSYV
jgi:hypothetical protein